MGDNENNTYPITGIQEGLGPAAGQVPLRQEIDAWSQNPANATQVNLFILAMARFQNLKVEDKLSFWQVAGIHGQPLVPWDENTESQSPGSGYCTHGSILFPLWHRPYIVLFEQRLYEIMRDDIIPSFPQNQQADLLAAAQTWRFPYWDWAAKKSRPGFKAPNYDVPLLVKSANVDVLSSTGKQTIANPLYSFKTKTPMGKHGIYGLQPIDSAPYDICEATSKCPPAPGPRTQAQWVDGVQNYDEVVSSLRGHQWYEGEQYTDTLGETVYRLFSEDYFSSYDTFSSTAYVEQGGSADYLSLEDIHNNIHNWVGGENGGHMANVPVAAFDPIFWFHHCNIDRQCAIWQALNPNAWFDDPSQQLVDNSGNWSTPPGTTDTPNSALAPFHTDTQGTYWIANDVRDWTKLGYSYPELQPWLPQYNPNGQFSQDLYSADISKQVNALYSNARTLLLKQPAPAAFSARGPTDVHHGAKIVEENDYVVNVLYERFELGGQPFTIHIFIGKDTRVGSVYNFSTPADTTGGTEGCDNCRSQESNNKRSTGQVPIIGALIKDIADESKPLNSLEHVHVQEYLKETLHWKVTKVHGEEVELNSLVVSLAAGTGRHYGDHARRSKYHNYKILHVPTEGRPGGYSRPGHGHGHH
ncbi:Di-copper centre-containing protein [Sistotremastrum niveocremeum HHB9708]|uniref:tyrosinase n=1 Tax=Sistotremastrum niveocremeum HHB9708 TaxID=1314777 RepID=A0A164RBJ3_9AGAM|nr:Di-copper centre-containing protein [Sistotremastrum niveocremeum HHB9708]